MCEFISFFHRPDNGDIAVYDLTSHSKTQEELKLNNLWREGHYKPDGSIECRVVEGDKTTQIECNERLKNSYPTFQDFLVYVLNKLPDNYTGSLYLSSLTSAAG